MPPRSVLVLLVSALWALPAGAAAPPVETRAATALELRFSCPRPVTSQAEYLPGTRLVVEVPQGCAGAGQKFLIELRCGKTWCKGTLFQESEPAASLRGSRERMRTRDVARWAPALKALKVRVLGDTRLAVDVSAKRGVPVDVHVANGDVSTSYRLASGEAGIVRWNNPRGEVALALHLQRTRPDEAYLTVVSDKGRTVLNVAFPLGGQREVSCEEAGLDCEGRVRFTVRETEPTRL
ncbi:MAG: hypothetical protein L0Y64_20400 [Myxococcaceae bacterium]|nr:hypothetical protein [Myxococcaceae bacterium]